QLAGTLGSLHLDGTLRASVYDLGVIVLAWRSQVVGATRWEAVADALTAATDLPPPLAERFHATVEEIERGLRPAINRPLHSEIVEDYSVLFVERLSAQVDLATLARSPVLWGAALGESRQLSASAAALVTTMSYYPDDLALLTWNSTILIDSDPLAAATAADL